KSCYCIYSRVLRESKERAQTCQFSTWPTNDLEFITCPMPNVEVPIWAFVSLISTIRDQKGEGGLRKGDIWKRRSGCSEIVSNVEHLFYVKKLVPKHPFRNQSLEASS